MKIKFQKLKPLTQEPIIQQQLIQIFANEIIYNDYFKVSYSAGIKLTIPENHVAILLSNPDSRNLKLLKAFCPLNLDDEIILDFSKDLSAATIPIYEPGDCIAQIMILETKKFLLEESIELTQNDYTILQNAIMNESEPNDTLKKAAEKFLKK